MASLQGKGGTIKVGNITDSIEEWKTPFVHKLKGHNAVFNWIATYWKIGKKKWRVEYTLSQEANIRRNE